MIQVSIYIDDNRFRNESDIPDLKRMVVGAVQAVADQLEHGATAGTLSTYFSSGGILTHADLTSFDVTDLYGAHVTNIQDGSYDDGDWS